MQPNNNNKRQQNIRDEMSRRAQAWGGGEDSGSGGHAPDTLVVSQSRDGALLRPTSGAGGSSSSAGGGMEGPLPAEARALIHASCTGDAAEQAETYARRLLSTHRRVRVYREELQYAVEEVDDIRQVAQKNSIVCDALEKEMKDIDARIQALLSEKQMCQVQYEQERSTLQRNEGKRFEAERRVEVLRNTIDNITRETQRGHMLLRQLVPNLQIENYCL